MGAAYLEVAWLVDCGIEGKLDALDQVEDYGIFETARAYVSASLYALGQGIYISWKRIWSRSRALVASLRSIAESMVCCMGAWRKILERNRRLTFEEAGRTLVCIHTYKANHP